MTLTIKQKVENLRQVMTQNNIQVYVVPSDDAHQSEYVCEYDHRREYISGFNGSAGTAVITTDQCLLWTDGRYWLQAGQQLQSDWKIMKDRVQGEPTIEEWISKTLPAGTTIGMDSRLIAKSSYDKFRLAVEKANQKIITLEHNLVDHVRESLKSEEPVSSYPTEPVFFLPLEYSGKSSTDKIKEIRESLVREKADFVVITALDEVAWLLNLRGSDVTFNPVFLSYAIVGHTTAQLFINEQKVPADVRANLPGVEICSYDSIYSTLRSYSEQKKRVWIDPRSSLSIYNCVNKDNLIEKDNPILLAKAIKNPVEIEGFRQCHIRDGAALVQYLAWLEEEIVVKHNSTLTEYSAAQVLENYRTKVHDYISLSFASISSIGSNGAIIHYSPSKETCKTIDNQVYLIDSGGQYRDGTTDVTRTTRFGTPTDHEKQCYTRVLKGHIQLSILKFPPKINGYQIDCIARVPLWSVGLDYGHGTGHGVGAFLNVHEGPHSLTFRSLPHHYLICPNMTLTNEPGYYEEGKFGMRIENVMVTVQVQLPHSNSFIGFETVTMTPYERDLIIPSLLSEEEMQFVNNYHAEVLQKLTPLLQSDPRALDYLRKKTAPLSK
ncbi:hypothetical protein SAMD00019534_090600, partial [Acytostelium subglobosum LB1]|uniref:hypothetical protein n=1 Tax=Acytostelium subglobosum LB1 TaxID=1410327 RepID=UPI000644F168